MSLADKIAEELDALTEEYEDLQASLSEVVEPILTAYFQSGVDHETRVCELVIRQREGTLCLVLISLQQLQSLLKQYFGSTEELRPAIWAVPSSVNTPDIHDKFMSVIIE